jgi:hypothetical protein
MRKLIFSIFFLLLTSSFALAQNSVPKIELFTGYSHLQFEKSGELNGITGSITGNVTKSVGLVADVTGLYSRGNGSYLLLFGPRYSFRQFGRVTPFAQALFGGIAPDAAFAMSFGGGLDLKVNKHISLRLVQADYLQLRNGGSTLNSARVSTGIVFNIGSKD